MSLSNPYPKIYKLVLNSANARYFDGEFVFDINLPTFDHLHTKVGYVVGVDSFYTSSTPAGITAVGGGLFGNLHMRELAQITSYSSEKKAQSDVILTFITSGVRNNLTTSSVGLPLVDEGFFINKNLTFYFSNNALVKTIEPQSSAWEVTLCIWKAAE